jgi:hypothetical protein
MVCFMGGEEQAEGAEGLVRQELLQHLAAMAAMAARAQAAAAEVVGLQVPRQLQAAAAVTASSLSSRGEIFSKEG